jgi:hypothetical protein
MDKEKVSLIFSTLLFLMFSWMAWEAISFKQLARYFPLYIAIGGAILTLIDIFKKIIKLRKQRQESKEPLHENLAEVIKYILWFVGYLVVIYVAGLVLATAIFLAAFLLIEAKLSFIKIGISVGSVLIAIMVFDSVMKLYWPRSLLGSFLGW